MPGKPGQERTEQGPAYLPLQTAERPNPSVEQVHRDRFRRKTSTHIINFMYQLLRVPGPEWRVREHASPDAVFSIAQPIQRLSSLQTTTNLRCPSWPLHHTAYLKLLASYNRREQLWYARTESHIGIQQRLSLPKILAGASTPLISPSTPSASQVIGSYAGLIQDVGAHDDSPFAGPTESDYGRHFWLNPPALYADYLAVFLRIDTTEGTKR